jgi:hypothetical protein
MLNYKLLIGILAIVIPNPVWGILLYNLNNLWPFEAICGNPPTGRQACDHSSLIIEK